MNSQKGYVINVVFAGFMAVVVLSTVLFFGRFLCLQTLLDLMPSDMALVRKSPSGLLGDWDMWPKESVTDSNAVASPSSIVIQADDDIMANLGFLEAFDPDNRSEQLVSPDIYGFSEEYEGWRHMFYFDKALGLLVSCDIGREGLDDKGRWTGKWIKKINWYAGPRGISQKPGGIGRFGDFLVFRNVWLPYIVVFDRDTSQFVRIDFEKKEVQTGPKIEPNIVQIGRLIKNDRAMMGPILTPPQRKITKYKTRPNGKVVEYARYESILQKVSFITGTGSELVLDNSGTIYKLNLETLELEERIGALPWPGVRGSLAYEVKPISIQGSYAGLIAGGIGPDIFRPGFLVFDEDGNPIREERGDVELSRFGGGPGLWVANFVLETLHAPILQLAAYFTSLMFDGADGPRSLFILPNSLVGRKGAYCSREGLVEYILGLWVILPSLAISVLLAWRVEKDARKVGISSKAKCWWAFTTVAFGLAAYITYRLTRPQLALVTCANCGCPRRPDMERCHRCGSRWLVPELIPPLWRVIEKSRLDETRDFSPDQPNHEDSEQITKK
ncbi:MAG TPA: hypothetical protein HPP87_02050 [Planctomycetes bacterium]|nr:hypothetical protein [Planctomycetota bacterium]HIJ70129.1 hypothetical protein [Planctomycetota bacterium]